MVSLTSFYSTTVTAPWAASLIPDTGQGGRGGGRGGGGRIDFLDR